ncbi:SPOR domain-containing protein [Candidatus Omnitrophota bacterium]
MPRKISLFVFACCLFISGELLAQTASIKKVETLMLRDQYQRAASEARKILTHHQKPSIKSKAYYLLGVCLLKQAKYAQARDSFRIILRRFRQTKLADDASLGVADSYLLAGEFKQAQKNYQKFLQDFPRSRLASLARKHLEQAKQGKHIANSYFTVQVGVFSKKQNATKLRNQLIGRGFQAFMLHLPSEDLYRIRVGKFNNRMDAEFLEQRLKNAGFPTKVCP